MSKPSDFNISAQNSRPENGQDRLDIIRQLHHAINSDDLNALKNIIRTRLDLNDHNQAGLCPLTQALCAGKMQAAALLLKSGADPQNRAYTAVMECTDTAPLDFLLSRQSPTPVTLQKMFIESVRSKSEQALIRLHERGLLQSLTADTTLKHLRQQTSSVRSQEIKDFAFSLLHKIKAEQQQQWARQQALAEEQRIAQVLARSAKQKTIYFRSKKRKP